MIFYLLVYELNFIEIFLETLLALIFFIKIATWKKYLVYNICIRFIFVEQIIVSIIRLAILSYDTKRLNYLRIDSGALQFVSVPRFFKSVQVICALEISL